MNLFQLAVSGKIALLSASEESGKGNTTIEVENPTVLDLSASSGIKHLRVSDVIEECDALECHTFDFSPADGSITISEW